MRTRAQTSSEVQQQQQQQQPVGRTGLRSKFRLKVTSNGGSHEQQEREKDGLKKRKAPELDDAELATPPVIKKHKRGLNRQQQSELSPSKPGEENKFNESSRELEDESLKPRRDGEEEEEEDEVKEKKNSAMCTVNSECNNSGSQPRAEVSETSCSMNSGGDQQDALPPKATRTPLSFPTIPAKRSPLPLPSAVRSAFPAAPPAVRSALPAPPAVRSALPLPSAEPAEVQNEEDGADEIETLTDEVDILGFSSAVTGSGMAMQDRSGDEDGLVFDEDGMLMGNLWPDDSCLMEMRKRSGPGSRATYRCSKCLAPKKGHRCPLDAEENRDDSKNEAVPSLSHKLPVEAPGDFPGVVVQKSPERSVDELLTEISRQEDDDGASPSKPEPPAAAAASSLSSDDAGKGSETHPKTKPSSELVVREFSISAKWLLETGILEGHRVRYMPRAGEVLGTGVVKSGVITCSCRQCKGLQGYNASSFEKHVGSTARHPSDFIYLDNGRCLREILEDGSRFKDKVVLMDGLRAAVSKDWDGGCSKCGKPGDLSVICSGKQCLNCYHQDCAGVSSLRMRGWLCSDCQQKQGPSSRSSRFRLRSAS